MKLCEGFTLDKTGALSTIIIRIIIIIITGVFLYVYLHVSGAGLVTTASSRIIT
jgi:hypothetical protein